MKKKIIRPTKKWKLVCGVLAALVLLYLVTLLFSYCCTPKLYDRTKDYTPEQIAETRAICHQPESLKGLTYSVAQPVKAKDERKAAEFFRKHADAAPEEVAAAVKKGKIPAWYPRGEAPILQQLVKEGVLPPVAQRVGPEPVVMRPADGAANYGGVWVQFVAGTSTAEAGSIMTRMSYQGLFRFSPLGYPIVPHIAKSYEVKEKGRIWDITLRKINWSDGHPFTADDIMHWYRDCLSTSVGSGMPPGILKVNGKYGRIIKLDRHKVRFELPEPRGDFLEMLAYNGCYAPSHYLKKYHPDYADPAFLEKERVRFNLKTHRSVYNLMKNSINPERPSLSQWITRRYNKISPLYWVRNPYYFCVDEQGNQLPYIDRIQVEMIDQQMMPMAVASGRAAMQFRYIRFEQFAQYMANSIPNDFKVYGWLGGSRSEWLMSPNQNRLVTDADKDSPFKAKLLVEKEFRQALSLAIDRPTAIRAIYSGQAQPTQADPGPYSIYSSEKMRYAYTKYDPAEANRKLDRVWKKLGLDPAKRSQDGFRVDVNGRVPVFYLYFTDFTGMGPAQFVVDDWAKVGIRCVFKSLSRPLLNVRGSTRDFDFSVWSSESENLPMLSARTLTASDSGAGYGRGWFKWYSLGGMQGDPRSKNPGCIPIPEDHIMMEAVKTYYRFRTTMDQQVRNECMKKLTDIAAENVWTIAVACSQPKTLVVSNKMKNVPRKALEGYMMYTPGNTAPETFCLTEFQSGTEEDTMEQLRTPGKMPEANPPKSFMTYLLRGLFAGIVVLFLALMALRHPFVLRRLVIMVPTLLIISVCVFTIIQLPPGDYLSNRIVQLQESGQTQEEIDLAINDLREMFRFDDPAWQRYCRWMGFTWFVTLDKADRGLLQGEMGYSMETCKSVNSMVGDRITLTIIISLFSIVFTWIVALPIGIYSAVRQYSFWDYVLTVLGFLGMCIPGFLLALIVMAATGVNGLFSDQFAVQPFWDWPKVLDMLGHIWAPVIVCSVAGTAGMIRVMRANLLDELRKPYVTTARAKGVRPGKLLFKYPVRLALNPFISGIGGLFPRLVSGSSIVAIVMSLPTVGPLMLGALFSQDMNMAGSMLMVLSTLSVFGTLVSDLLLIAIDPRIRIGGGSAK